MKENFFLFSCKYISALFPIEITFTGVSISFLTTRQYRFLCVYFQCEISMGNYRFVFIIFTLIFNNLTSTCP